MQLTPHFSLVELTATNHKIDNAPSTDQLHNLLRLAQVLEDVRKVCCNYPVRISSGFRSLPLNEKVGGSDTSAHTIGLAADFTIAKLPLTEVFTLIWHSDIKFDQLILEPSWIHLGLAVGQQRRQGLKTVDKKTYYPYYGE